MTRPRVIHHGEYLVLTLLLVGAAIWQRDALTVWFWVLLIAPDVVGFLPSVFYGVAPRGGLIAPQVVPWYNASHTFTIPLLLWAAMVLLALGGGWPLLGWLIHIAADRTLGFGLRGDDGGQALL